MARKALVVAVVWSLSAGVLPAWATAQDPVVAIVLEDDHGLVRRGLSRAQSIVGDIYRNAHVTVAWESAAAATADRVLTVTITTSAGASPGLGPDALGVAPSPGDGTRGTQAYVFVDRVKRFAEKHRLAMAHVLAGAIAHEVAHLLLPPNAHTAEGIMRPRWHPKQFPPNAAGVPGFPEAQARLLRLRSRRQS